MVDKSVTIQFIKFYHNDVMLVECTFVYEI